MTSLALVRHGQSEWNKQFRFSGWSATALSPKGVEQSEAAGRLLRRKGYRFDVCFTSVLERGCASAAAVLRGMETPDMPIEKSWRLNERHFGALQGLGRMEAVRAFGLMRVLRLQGSYTDVPPPLDSCDPRYAAHDPLFAGLTEKEIPKSESLADTYARVIPYWQESIVPHLKAQRSVLIVGHKNSLRVLAQRIESLADEAVPKLRLMTGAPLVYDFDSDLNLLGHGFLEPQPRFNRWAGLSPA